MAEKIPRELETLLKSGIAATKKEEYLVAFNIFSELYKDGFVSGTMEGLSYYGLTLAILQRKYREALELCTKAVKQQFLDPYHYLNLAKVHIAMENRKKAVQTLESGLKQMPRNRVILTFWKSIGLRARPAIPFLSRNNPVNKALGRTRHLKKTEK